MTWRDVSILVVAAVVVACGGDVTIVGPGTTGAGAGGAGGSASGAGGDGGSGGCTTHQDCGPGRVCLPHDGTCADACTGNDDCDGCGPGLVCDTCASKACPTCPCVTACRPISKPWECDVDDPCPPPEQCGWHGGCIEVCETDADCRYGFCGECLTSSCCGCDDCVSGCLDPT